MSNLNFDFAENDFRPLAARMRPTNLEQYYGQTHLIGEGKPLRKAIQAGHVHSMILWGPPGTGKTTLAEIIAHRINAEVERISAVTSGVKEIRESIERAKQIDLQIAKRFYLWMKCIALTKANKMRFYPILKMVRLFLLERQQKILPLN